MLEQVRGPRDLKGLTPEQLDALAAEIRTFLVENVSRTGGHLGPNLGVVELTLALHRVFDSPRDTIVWDTGHQAYVHKILTGRQADFADAAPARRPLGLPEPGRVRRTTSSRTATPRRRCRGPTAWPRRCAADRRAGPPGGGRRDRRRRAHRRAWPGRRSTTSRRRRPPAGHRRQRQRAVLRADHRRARAPPRDAAHHPGLRAVPRVGQARCSGGRPWSAAALRHAARGQEGPQGHRRAAGHVRGPRPEVHRPGRRARRRRRWSTRCAGPGLRRPGHRARDHPQGARLRAGREGRGRPLPRRSASSTRRPGRR